MMSVLMGRTKAVKLLLAAGADTTIPEQDGYTPMHGAGFQGRGSIAKLLINHGLNPSDMHKDGFTPIHRACWGMEKRHTATVRVLLEHGVSVGEQTRDGQEPYQLTRNEGTKKLLFEYARKAASASPDEDMVDMKVDDEEAARRIAELRKKGEL